MLCLQAGGALARLALTAFTLAWTHSVEHTRWEEDWRIEDGMLRLVESRVQGSGAGMEPGPDSRLEGGFWRFDPRLSAQAELRLARSAAVPDWQLCAEGQGCRELGSFLAGIAVDTPLSLRPCS